MLYQRRKKFLHKILNQLIPKQQKNDQDTKSIQNIKQDLENQNQMQRQKQIELFEMKTENQQLSEINQQKEIELANFQAEFHKISEQNNRMATQKSSMENQLDSLQQEKKQFLGLVENGQKNNDEMLLKQHQLEKIFSELQFQKSMLLKQINYANNQNQALQMEQRSKFDHLEYIKQQTADAEISLKQLERDLLELTQIVETTQQDSTQFNSNFQVEQTKGLELQKSLQSVEIELRERIQQLSQLKSENQKARNENMELLNINQQLSQDLEALKAHILLLVDKNQQFLGEFEGYSKEDLRICEIVNRSTKINELKEKSEDQINNSLIRIQDKK